MKFAYDVPGYVLGHRFSQDKRFYDATNNRFLDLAGYGGLDGHCVKTSGTATFSNHGTFSREGLKLDNSNQWQVASPIPWEGTVVLVIKPHIPTPSTVCRFLTWGNNGTLGQDLGINSANNNTGGPIDTSGFVGPGATTIFPAQTGNDDTIIVLAYEADQEIRKVSSTKDAVTVTQSAAAAGATNGFPIAPGASLYTSLLGDPQMKMERLGNNSGVVGNTAANATNFVYIFERHYFKGHPLRENLPEMKEFFDNLRAYYGVA